MLTTFLILILMSLGYFATDIYLPSFPALTKFYQTTDNTVQLTLFSYLITFALTPLFFGPLSDLYGRKKIMRIGLLVTLIATIGCYLPVSIYWLIAWRAIQGIGTGAVVVATRAMIADLFTGKELARKISYITMLLPLIFATAPILGGFLQEQYNWQAVFLFLALYIAVIRLTLPLLEESLKDREKKNIKQLFTSYKHVLTSKPFMLYTVCVILPTAGTFGYLASSPFLFQTILGLSPSQYGLLALLVGSSIIISSFVNARLLYRLQIETLQKSAALIILLSGFILLLVHLTNALSVITLIIPIMLYFACIPFGSSNSASKAMNQLKTDYGAANAILTCAQFLIGALSSFVFSFIENNNALPLALCFIVVGLLFSIGLYLALKSDSQSGFD